jgi:DNA mismatch endonuclease (patch repair protein)
MDLSERMAAIRGRNTKPELEVRRLVHRLGYRFRLHRSDLPGSPDLVFPGRRAVILVHGCFWHQHDCKLGQKLPRARPEYWLPKLARNKARDTIVLDQLKASGWMTLVIWECELADLAAIAEKVRTFLDGVVDAYRVSTS